MCSNDGFSHRLHMTGRGMQVMTAGQDMAGQMPDGCTSGLAFLRISENATLRRFNQHDRAFNRTQ